MAAPAIVSNSFSLRLLRWFDQHGRKDLPWQQDITPYRVWVSEIMLQQTQVATVIPYYQRFMARFPDVASLAAAHIDEVLALWTGLGYYARARNLHRAAQTVISDWEGVFPSQQDDIQTLPGIGRSTAAAITSIACGGSAAILDGNVKRVLSRHAAIDGWPGKREVEQQLWALAEQYTPSERTADYTQAIMDLGATLCRRSKPDCERCPVADDCKAKAMQRQSDYPGKKPRKTLPVKRTHMLLIENPAGEILLEKRPASGIWGGLWSLPEVEDDGDITDTLERLIGFEAPPQALGELRHTFSHYHLDIQPQHIRLSREPARIMEADRQLWYKGAQHQPLGLAAPVKKLLDSLLQNDLFTD